MNPTRPFSTRPLLTSKHLREALTAARAAGLELRAAGGKWTLHPADKDALFAGRTVARRGSAPAHWLDDRLGIFDTLEQAAQYCERFRFGGAL